MILSQATEANWQRLKSNTAQKLQHGANKTRSRRKIYPLEYLRNKENLAFAEKVLAIARKNSLPPENAIFSIACLLLKKHNILHCEHVKKVLSEYDWSADKALAALQYIPMDEWDILGFIYQCMQSEGRKNTSGSYYTPETEVKAVIENCMLASGEKILDPACGSGSFLLAFESSFPEQLFGCDLDKIAVFIAKVNLLCKYKSCVFTPQIYCMDFLSGDANDFFYQKFGRIVGNPPWGAKNNLPRSTAYGKIKDTFSLFLLQAYNLLEQYGSLSFLLPQAVLNIKTHKNIRSFLLTGCCLEKIEYIEGCFTGVMTGHVKINLRRDVAGKSFIISKNGDCKQVMTDTIIADTAHILSYKSDRDDLLINKIASQKKYDLSASIFALGIVTGNNKSILKDEPQEYCEAVYTGKEITPYTLKEPRKFLNYERSKLQQTAPDEYYRAGEKLVYKFISSEPVFAYDNSGSLFLNSANILIPQIDNLGIKTVLALLNSEVLRFYYKVKFADVKVLKGNLTQLPLPHIAKDRRQEIEEIVNQLLSGNTELLDKLQKLIYHCYNLSDADAGYIKSILYR